MASLGGNIRPRILAVLILLAVRPCVALLNAEFLSSQSRSQARIEYIDEDIAIERVAWVRQTWVGGSHSFDVSIACLFGLTEIRPPFETSFEIARPRSARAANFLTWAAAPRAPPLA
jgi:hypothetical protein